MQNLLDPAILFFVLGVLAGAVRSNLGAAPAIAKFLSLYLLMALGLKGGFALAHSGFTGAVTSSLAAAIAMALIVPALGYAVLRTRVSGYDAAAVAASYGSVSAVTFVTAMQYLETNGMAFGGHMAVAMVAMESPAVLMAVAFANMLRQKDATPAVVPLSGGAAAATLGGREPSTPIGKVLHESFTDRHAGAAAGRDGGGIPERRRGQGRDAAVLRRPVQGDARVLPAEHGNPGREERRSSAGAVARAHGLREHRASRPRRDRARARRTAWASRPPTPRS